MFNKVSSLKKCAVYELSGKNIVVSARPRVTLW